MMWRTPGFWYAPKPGSLARLLQPLGAIYGAITARRMAGSGEQASLPVICIGNVTAGGAGKTPTVLTLAALMSARGFAPAIVTRGHGGSLHGPVLVSPSGHGPEDVGDEPLMMARRGALVVVARDRPAGVAYAASLGATMAILDDGLQNASLKKEFSLAVVDGAVGIGNGLCVPAGPLRAPLAAQWHAIDALLVIGDGEAGEQVAEKAHGAAKPVFTARLAPDASIAASLVGQQVLALAGIGRPEKFSETLQRLGARVAETAFFADHHAYSAQDVAQVSARAAALKLTVVTTQKDAVRLHKLWDISSHGPLTVLPVELRLDQPEYLTALAETSCSTAA
ncbi:MAG: tetraacyldisaccharide 4'-kinase [Bosea sp. (in: a-proteobacteria)]